LAGEPEPGPDADPDTFFNEGEYELVVFKHLESMTDFMDFIRAISCLRLGCGTAPTMAAI
jgi:hypothetical protein